MKSKLQLAGCVILDEKGRVLLLHRETSKRVQWETPGGKVEPGESEKQAAVREVKEELGVDVKILKVLGRKGFEEDEQSMEYVWMKARITKGEPQILEPDKFDEFKYFDWEELRGMQGELSLNTMNLVGEYFKGKIKIK